MEEETVFYLKMTKFPNGERCWCEQIEPDSDGGDDDWYFCASCGAKISEVTAEIKALKADNAKLNEKIKVYQVGGMIPFATEKVLKENQKLKEEIKKNNKHMKTFSDMNVKLAEKNISLKQHIKELEEEMCKRCKEQYYRERCDSCNLNKEK